MHRFIDSANMLTLCSLLAALASAALAIHGRTGYALAALIASGICDLFDGPVARRLDRDLAGRQFGKSLDSIVDGCAFGFAPAVLLYCAGMDGPAELVLLAGLPICVVWRVAYFDALGLQSSADARYYTGLPATYVALVIPLAAMFGFIEIRWFRWSESIAVAALCVAMIASVPVRKPSGLAYGGFLILAIAVTGLLCWLGQKLPTSMLN